MRPDAKCEYETDPYAYDSEWLSSIELMRDRTTNESLGLHFSTCLLIGFGFIDFATEEDAIHALNGYNGRPIRFGVWLL